MAPESANMLSVAFSESSKCTLKALNQLRDGFVMNKIAVIAKDTAPNRQLSGAETGDLTIALALKVRHRAQWRAVRVHCSNLKSNGIVDSWNRPLAAESISVLF